MAYIIKRLEDFIKEHNQPTIQPQESVNPELPVSELPVSDVIPEETSISDELPDNYSLSENEIRESVENNMVLTFSDFLKFKGK